MKRYILITFILLIISTLTIAAQGLKFNGSNKKIDNRTSLEIINKKKSSCQNILNLNFDLFPYNEIKEGYALRIKTIENGPIINLYYDNNGDDISFKLIWEGRNFVSQININKSEFKNNSKWMNINIRLLPQKDSIYLKVNKHIGKGNIDLPPRINPNICFGKSEYLIDIPTFAIRNLQLDIDDSHIKFDLNETHGTFCKSNRKNVYGVVKNGIWLASDYSRWNKNYVFSSAELQRVGYDKNKHEIYIFTSDSIKFINIDTDETRVIKTQNSCPVKSQCGTNFITDNGDIYAYEVYYPNIEDQNRPTIAKYNVASNLWETISTEQLPIQLHHHGEFLNTKSNEFYIFGGFGNSKYSSDVYKFNIEDSKWSRLDNYKGDKIWPRFFLGMGYNESNNLIYIFGGMGNESGEQIIGRQYLYNLYTYNIEDNSFKKIWDLNWKENNFVVSRNLILDNKNNFYCLCYPEYLTNSMASLYKFSIKDGTYEKLGNEIPIYSDKITTNANIYYDKSLEKIIATIEESSNDISSKTSIYTLNFPPQPYVKENGIWGKRWILISIFLTSLLIIILFIRKTYWHKKYRKHNNHIITPNQIKPNSILLFGELYVFDRNGNDISSLFTNKLLQLFCLIISKQGRGGINSKHLTALLWPDKEGDKAKNVKGVTINNLRKVLSNLDGISLNYSDNNFYFDITDEFYCDYLEFFKLYNKPDKIDNIISILIRGSFLQSYKDSFYDNIKERIEQHIEPLISLELPIRYSLKEYYNTIHCAEILFNIDPLHDAALLYKIKSLIAIQKADEANVFYQSFINRYKKDYGEDYKLSFDDIVNTPDEQ